MLSEEFIKKAEGVHGDKYDYSKVEYVNTHTKVCIVCPEHGEFWQTPSHHLRGQGCAECGGKIKLTKEEFIKKAKKIHGDKYDYSKVEYVNNKTKVCIICPEHGEFWQTPANHLKERGCYKCGRKTVSQKIAKNNAYFVGKAKKIHGNKYDYSKTDITKQDEKGRVIITCPIHGDFLQNIYRHINGNGCKKCKNDKLHELKTKTKEEFLKQSRLIHNDRYDYSKVEYVNTHTKVCIVCPEHGEFWQTPHNHLRGQGCAECGGKIKLTKEEFIKKAEGVHGDKYDYSKVEYVNNCTKVCIICPEHGEFWQTPAAHLQGQGCAECGGIKRYTNETFKETCLEKYGNSFNYDEIEYINAHIKIKIKCNKCQNYFYQTPNDHLSGKGCPICKESNGEKMVRIFLENMGIKFIRSKKFTWLGQQHLDFYLPDYNIAIECQGIQHFEPIDFFGGEEALKKQNERDFFKKYKCEENKIKIIYFTLLKKYNSFLNQKTVKKINELQKILENEKKLL